MANIYYFCIRLKQTEMLSHEIKEKLFNFKTPFYLYDIDLLRRTVRAAREGADRHGYHLHYAIKANFDPRVLDVMKEFGLGIDCVSGGEVRCAIESGFDPSGILFAGVGKTDEEIRYAVENGIMALNCESVEELEVVDSICAELGKVQNVCLRINPDVDPQTHRCISTGQADSKFGISYETAWEEAEKILALPNLHIMGLHLHVGSQIRHLEVFEQLCLKVNDIVKGLESRGYSFSSIDLGGGLGIDYDCPENECIPPFEAVYEIVEKTLDAGDRSVHFEFGRAMVGQSAELVTKVLFGKTTATGRKLVIVDASMTQLIRPALYGSHHAIENITSPAKEMDTYTVVGTVCESTDVFDRDVVLPLTERGDLVSIKSAGAYGASMASRYNLHDLPAAVYSDEL